MGTFEFVFPNPFADALCLPYFYLVVPFIFSSLLIALIFSKVTRKSIPLFHQWMDVDSFSQFKVEWNKEAHYEVVQMLEEKMPQSGVGELILSYLPHYSEIYEVGWWRYRKGGELERWKIDADLLETKLSIYPLIRPLWMLLAWIALLSVYSNWAAKQSSSWDRYAGYICTYIIYVYLLFVYVCIGKGLTVAMLYHPCHKMVGVSLWYFLHKHYVSAFDGEFRVSSFYKRAILAVMTRVNGIENAVGSFLIAGIGIAVYATGFCVFIPLILLMLAVGLFFFLLLLLWPIYSLVLIRLDLITLSALLCLLLLSSVFGSVQRQPYLSLQERATAKL
ncbi:hypothetical protein RFI_05115 [Reticulomyxa filosa]|uniref:Uncharacterized protein n=1 Tax=Reticulomyxa filosa TaxID=46433 RepID=X6P188_RETFI|nr:hypothetical protein RFI_05115 [Reticulomyxa filosa]|eukprot:ETO32001.1 hypothetical protein RFI_05115 [Reticulomyxa filosa]